MKNQLKKKALKTVSKIILKTAEKEANSACIYMGFQPVAPNELKRLRKF